MGRLAAKLPDPERVPTGGDPKDALPFRVAALSELAFLRAPVGLAIPSGAP